MSVSQIEVRNTLEVRSGTPEVCTYRDDDGRWRWVVQGGRFANPKHSFLAYTSLVDVLAAAQAEAGRVGAALSPLTQNRIEYAKQDAVGMHRQDVYGAILNGRPVTPWQAGFLAADSGQPFEPYGRMGSLEAELAYAYGYGTAKPSCRIAADYVKVTQDALNEVYDDLDHDDERESYMVEVMSGQYAYVRRSI